MIGGLAIHQGKLAEMRTGEGKTLAAVAPACLRALSGHGVHVLTFNDYLARRDAEWMGPIYRFLGLCVGFVQQGMSVAERQVAYRADVTYVTAKEAGFDFLRDHLCLEPGRLVHRPFHFAIIDEADSILIDEARVPLVIAGNAAEPPESPHDGGLGMPAFSYQVSAFSYQLSAVSRCPVRTAVGLAVDEAGRDGVTCASSSTSVASPRPAVAADYRPRDNRSCGFVVKERFAPVPR